MNHAVRSLASALRVGPGLTLAAPLLAAPVVAAFVLPLGGVAGGGGGPKLGWMVAGFAILMAGLATLAPHRHARGALDSPRGTRRALMYALFYGLCATSFARVLAGAFLGQETSVWLLALGDVVFVTLGLFAWVMLIAEGHTFTAYGLHGGPSARMMLATVMGLGPVVILSGNTYAGIWMHHRTFSSDQTVFALMFATVGSVIPEELLFRGFLQGSLGARFHRWARVALPALAFTAVRAFRFLPGNDIPLDDWLFYIFGLVLPLGLWWGLMRDWAGGSIWSGLISHFLVVFGPTLTGASPVDF